MATFYILPAREKLEESLGNILHRYLPGMPLPVEMWDRIVEILTETPLWPCDTYLLSRDDLPAGTSVAEVLVESFGGEAGDRVMEIAHHTSTSRQWFIPNGISEEIVAC